MVPLGEIRTGFRSGAPTAKVAPPPPDQPASSADTGRGESGDFRKSEEGTSGKAMPTGGTHQQAPFLAAEAHGEPPRAKPAVLVARPCKGGFCPPVTMLVSQSEWCRFCLLQRFPQFQKTMVHKKKEAPPPTEQELKEMEKRANDQLNGLEEASMNEGFLPDPPRKETMVKQEPESEESYTQMGVRWNEEEGKYKKFRQDPSESSDGAGGGAPQRRPITADDDDDVLIRLPGPSGKASGKRRAPEQGETGHSEAGLEEQRIDCRLGWCHPVNAVEKEGESCDECNGLAQTLVSEGRSGNRGRRSRGRREFQQDTTGSNAGNLHDMIMAQALADSRVDSGLAPTPTAIPIRQRQHYQSAGNPYQHGKGQNKGKGRGKRAERIPIYPVVEIPPYRPVLVACCHILRGLECSFGDRCRYIHNVEETLARMGRTSDQVNIICERGLYGKEVFTRKWPCAYHAEPGA